MKAMILAAGRGERMRPLTDSCPKPLLMVGGKPLIVWHLQRLAAAGFSEVVINHAHLGAMLVERIGDGRTFGLSIAWSAEPPGALGTAGGIAHALPLLGEEPFLVINGDIFCDWDVARAPTLAASLLAQHDLAHLVMVPSPAHHAQGDFVLQRGRIGDADLDGHARLTFSGIGIYAPTLLADVQNGAQVQLAPSLREAMRMDLVGGEFHDGLWFDIGTPARLAALETLLHAEDKDVAGAPSAWS